MSAFHVDGARPMTLTSVIIFAGILAAACASVSADTVIHGKPNLMIVGVDYDENTIERDNQISRRVLDTISNELQVEGFNVFDETAVTLQNYAQNRTRRSDAEIIDIARGLTKPPIDVLVAVSIYASAKGTDYTKNIRARLTGRLLKVQSGRRLGNFEVESPATWTAPLDCYRDCLLETIANKSKILARDFGAILAKMLLNLPEDSSTIPTKKAGSIINQYALVFEGFTPEDIMKIEEYLVVFSGYQHYRTVYSGLRHHEFWYESNIESARLDRNLKKMLTRLNLVGGVLFSGNEYTVTKFSTRKLLKIKS